MYFQHHREQRFQCKGQHGALPGARWRAWPLARGVDALPFFEDPAGWPEIRQVL